MTKKHKKHRNPFSYVFFKRWYSIFVLQDLTRKAIIPIIPYKILYLFIAHEVFTHSSSSQNDKIYPDASLGQFSFFDARICQW